MNTITAEDDSYPELLKEIGDAPPTLYIEGSLRVEDQFAVAVVGTREPTLWGRQMTEFFVSELVKASVAIVSGLARGIDTIAHKAALMSGGRTIAVLGSGFDHLYPPENKGLAHEIVKHGALVTPFEPSVTPKPEYFLARNQIIAGLSLAVLVVEGRARSGTISTANHMANLGREVFAIPGPVNSPMSEAPNQLIRSGAAVAQNPQSILDYIRGQSHS